jgi:pimeloyl-ACP methyl ester carboxylesterase
VFGYSSGAVFSLRAAARGLAIPKLALYETPLIAEGRLFERPEDLAARIAGLVEEGRWGEAVALFQTERVGIPADVVARLRRAPFWPAPEAMAHTLVYETRILGDGSVPRELAASVAAPTLVIAGGESAPFMREMAPALANAIPDAGARILEGQAHDLVLEEFLAA